MTGRTNHGRPPLETRFRKGESGNPKGRPRSRPAPIPSAFDVVMDRVLTVTQGGTARELTVEEALQQKTYQDAIAGNRAARREVLKMIAKREKYLADKGSRSAPILELLMEPIDPRNADEALILLGIAERAPKWSDNDPYDRLLLLPWAVQAALSRPGRRRLSDQDIARIERCTKDAGTLRWPKGARDEPPE